MSGKITRFLREYVLVFSIILTIVGFIVLIIGAMGIWYPDLPKDMMGLSEELLEWSLYLLILGLMLFGVGVYYIYSFFTNRKFVLEELETNKRSEFIKKHAEVKTKAKHLPSKYQKMLKEKEKELKIK
jgi:hypothetical protein